MREQHIGASLDNVPSITFEARVARGQFRVTAILYASNACRNQGLFGTNIVIFKNSVRAPDSVKIVGNTDVALEVWP
jgi:hypothetical protein